MFTKIFHDYKGHILETFKLSIPIILGRMGAVLMGVADSIMVGKISYEALAACGAANAVFISIAIIPIGMMIVGSPMIASAKSKDDTEGIGHILKSCMQISVFISLFFMCILTVITFNFEMFNQTKEVNALVKPYLHIINFSILPLMLFIAIEQFTDGLENTDISMFFNISALLLNIFLNLFLVYGFLGFPKMGLVGAAIGTLGARCYMCLGIWLVIRYKQKFKVYTDFIHFFSFDKQIFTKILQQGIPSGVQFFLEVSAFSVAAIIIGWFGVIPLAAHNVAMSVASITYMISTGFATGASIRVAYFFGKNDFYNLRKAFIAAHSLIVLQIILICSILLIFNNSIVSLYTNEKEVIQIATTLLFIDMIFQFADGIQVVSVRSLLSLEDVKIPAFLTLFSYWIAGLPLGYLISYLFNLNVYGIWWGFVIGILSASILLTYRFIYMVRKKESQWNMSTKSKFANTIQSSHPVEIKIPQQIAFY
jgi:multidrug resistance protein, MATE family